MIKQIFRVVAVLATLGAFLTLLGFIGRALVGSVDEASRGRQIPSITMIDAQNICQPAITRYAQSNADRVDRTGPPGVYTVIDRIDFKPALMVDTRAEVRGEVHYAITSPSVALPAQLNVVCVAGLVNNAPMVFTIDYER